jgi:cytidylate kinase
MGNRVITIGRQFGSGGHEVGVRLADKLGVKFYDKELVDMIAKEAGLEEQFLNEHDEKAPTPIYPVMPGFAMPIFYQQTPSDIVYTEQSKLVRKLAEESDCVIVGRCADYVLKDYGSVNCFIYADIEDRVARKLTMVPEGLEFTKEDIKKRIELVDKKRAKYYEYYTDRSWGAIGTYDICISTSKVGIDGAVDTIAEFLKNCR